MGAISYKKVGHVNFNPLHTCKGIQKSICSESLVRAIGKVLLMKFSWNTN